MRAMDFPMNIDPTYTYLLLNIGTILFPLLLSFDKKVAFSGGWKALFPAIFITGAVFLIWDVAFTEMGVWGFNPKYLIGIYFLGLPLEEWLFFLTIPYACVFIYACLKGYIQKELSGNWVQPVTYGLIAVLILVGALNLPRLYTSITFLGLAAWMGLMLKGMKANYLGRFYLAWGVSLIPFFLVNGVLTALPVVTYNDTYNLGIRMGTIPLEDSFYLMLLLAMNIGIYEILENRWAPLRKKGEKTLV